MYIRNLGKHIFQIT